MNHLVIQLSSFAPGDKEAGKRADDLMDCATYAASRGFREWPVK
jgi:hypothetical protein